MVMSGKTRFVVKKSLKNITIQAIQYQEKGDKILLGVSSRNLIKQGWNKSRKNIPAAYLTGLLAGKKAQEKKVTEGILDVGLKKPNKGGVIYAALKGLIDAGIKILHNEEALPNQKRLSGEHINQETTALFNQIKQKIIGEK